MSSRPRRAAVLAALGVSAALSLVACGDDSDGGSAAAPQAPIAGVRAVDVTAGQYHLHFVGPLQ